MRFIRSTVAFTLLVLLLLGVTARGVYAADVPDALPGWAPLWTRDAGSATAALDAAAAHEPGPCVRVQHTGNKDWSLAAPDRVAVQAGDILELSAWVKVEGAGSAEISVVTSDANDKVVEWIYGMKIAHAGEGWRQRQARIVVPAGVTNVLPRLTGDGTATIWVQGFAMKKAGNVSALRPANLPATLNISNKAITVTLHTADGTLDVLDQRTGRTWHQSADNADAVVTAARAGDALDIDLLQASTGLSIKASLKLIANLPEFTVSLTGDGELSTPLAFPQPFTTEAGTSLIVPMNEGISYPVDDATVGTTRLVAYGGHGICMRFWGVTDGKAGQMAILETPDDASIDIRRSSGLLCIVPEWEAQHRMFGPERRVHYVFFDQGGYVAMCKRYRDYAKQTGLFKTLAEKRKEIPAVDLLIGAVNVWCWDKNALAIVNELRQAGITRILWSNRGDPANIAAMNDLSVLTSRYDIYQDVMDPAQFPRLRYVSTEWPTAAWPKDLVLDAAGQWVHGWSVETKDGPLYPCGVLSDSQAIPYATKRITDDLATHPYRCRFIDTTTASAWREDYSPDHPMTRTDCRQWRMKLLDLVSRGNHLVTGSETGHDAAVPYVHYFEGMLSLGPYRVPDSGRDMLRQWDQVPAETAKFQVGYRYRLPLWELVYHDCVVAQWYWGDYSNKLPALWDKRDLFNALYGTPPMFMFTAQTWQRDKARFVRSYNATSPIARATGYSEMVNHRYLIDDRAVQQTEYANGVRVTVNFGDSAFRLPTGEELAAGACKVEGLPAAQ